MDNLQFLSEGVIVMADKGDEERQEKLTKAFNRLQQTHPELADGTRLLGGGHFGLTVLRKDENTSNPPDIITKVFYRTEPENQADAERAYNSEVTILHATDGMNLGDVRTPRLLAPPQRLENDPDFFATYSMTAVPGLAAGWNNKWSSPQSYKDDDPQQQRNHFREAGKLLARFHREAGERLNKTPLPQREWGGDIVQDPGFDDATNAALAKANEYLQARRKGGIIHGDYHGGNVLADENGHVTGLIDFGEVAHSNNMVTDFINIPSHVFAHFQDGYEEESGETIDPLIVRMTELACSTNFLQYHEEGSERRAELIRHINEDLEKVKSVTGYAPPAPTA
jgi:hypothetical protein